MAVAIAYVGTGTITTDGESFDFGNFNAATDGVMVVCFCTMGGGGGQNPSVSIGGTNGTNRRTAVGGDGNFLAAIRSRAVSAGNQNVTVNSPGVTLTAAFVAVYLMTGYTTEVPGDTTGALLSGTNDTITLNYGGSGVAVYAINHEDPGDPITWTSATEDTDANVDSTGQCSTARRSGGGSVGQDASWGSSDSGNGVYVGVVWSDPAGHPAAKRMGGVQFAHGSTGPSKSGMRVW